MAGAGSIESLSSIVTGSGTNQIPAFSTPASPKAKASFVISADP
jgi:hypothetical protein